jgi:hypothetical protein
MSVEPALVYLDAQDLARIVPVNAEELSAVEREHKAA